MTNGQKSLLKVAISTSPFKFLIPNSYLCRRMYLPGRRPKDRKKKNEKKKNIGVPSFNDILFEDGQESMGQDYWNVIPMGALDSVQTEAVKPVLPLHPHANDITTQCDKAKTKPHYNRGKEQQQKEGLDHLSVSPSETEQKGRAAAIAETVPKERKDYQGMPSRENRLSGRPALLSALLHGVAYETEQQEGGNHMSVTLEEVSYKEEQKHDHKAVPFQELQQPREQGLLKDTLSANEENLQEEQTNISTDSEGVTSLQELLSQPGVPCSEQQQLLEQRFAMEVSLKMKGQLAWDQITFVAKENADKKDQDYQNAFHQEVQQQLVEIQHPNSLSTISVNHEQEELGLHYSNIVSEASLNGTEYDDPYLFDQENHQLALSKAKTSSQGTTGEMEQEEANGIRNAMSDSVLSKATDDPCALHQVTLGNVMLPLDVIYAMEKRRSAPVNQVPENALVHNTEQKHLETQQFCILEHVSTCQHGITNEKEKQEGLHCAQSGPKSMAYAEDQKMPEYIVSEDISTQPDNISYEKEQQKKLDCGDSGPESICDKDDLDTQAALYLEGQQSLASEKQISLPLSATSEEEQHAGEDNSSVGSLEMPPMVGLQGKQEAQCHVLELVPSKEEEGAQEQEEHQVAMCRQAWGNSERQRQEAWLAPKVTFTSPEEQQQKEQCSIGLTSEELQKMDQQGLSNMTFTCNAWEEKGNM